MKKRILTGITTTGTPHVGNYIGAIRPALKLINKDELPSNYKTCQNIVLTKNTKISYYDHETNSTKSKIDSQSEIVIFLI